MNLLGVVGLSQKDGYITDLSFDILSLEALFLVPRYVVNQSISDVVTQNMMFAIGYFLSSA